MEAVKREAGHQIKRWGQDPHTPGENTSTTSYAVTHPIQSRNPMLNRTTRRLSAGGAVSARRATTTTAAKDITFGVVVSTSITVTNPNPVTALVKYGEASPPHSAKPSIMLTDTMRRAKSSRPVRRWSRGHSRANAHRNAGANANGYAYR